MENYMTPYENSNRYRMHKTSPRQPLLLKAWRELLKGETDNQIAEEIQTKRYQLFNQILPAYSSQ